MTALLKAIKNWKIILIVLLSAVTFFQTLKAHDLKEEIATIKIEQAEQIARNIEAVRDTEKAIKQKTDEISSNYENRIEQIQNNADRTIADINADRLRLRDNITIITASTDANTAESVNQARCELSTESQRFLIREAARADRNTEQLNALIDSVKVNQTFFERLDKSN